MSRNHLRAAASRRCELCPASGLRLGAQKGFQPQPAESLNTVRIFSYNDHQFGSKRSVLGATLISPLPRGEGYPPERSRSDRAGGEGGDEYSSQAKSAMYGPSGTCLRKRNLWNLFARRRFQSTFSPGV